MKIENIKKKNLIFSLFFLLFSMAVFSYAANYPLQIILPRAGGTAPDAGAPALSPDHFTLWAYPGIPYRMRAAVVGGDFPYTFALSGQPSGMTVDAKGVIAWPNPQTSDSSITLTVTDALGVQVQTTWGVTVQADKFRFVDCDAAGPGTGSLADPWRNLDNLPISFGGPLVGRILYFRACSAAGHYNALAPGFRNDATRKDFRSEFTSQQWLAYPGETPILDIGFQPGVETGVFIRFQDSPAAFIGFETIHGYVKHINLIPNVHYAVLWDNVFRDLAGQAGTNPAFLMTETGGESMASYLVVQDNEFSNWGHRLGGTGGSCMKFYSQFKLLVEDNLCRDAVGSNDVEGIALKGGRMDRVTVRGNVIRDVPAHGIGGNNHVLSNSEFLHNLVYNASVHAFHLNQDGMITTPVHVYRNTFVGRVMVANLDADTGPLNFNRNVIISADPVGGCKPGSRVACFPINDPSRLVMTENLEGASADGIVNAVGSLQGAWRTQYLGLRGHELSGSTPPPPPSGSRCDLDVNGSTTITDVQLCVNQAIGVTACTTADIDLSGSCNVVDVQRVVNAALGGSCITQ